MVDRCVSCSELVTRCRCELSPVHRCDAGLAVATGALKRIAARPEDAEVIAKAALTDIQLSEDGI